jgi:small subunit ribosomal protein S19
MSRSLKKGPWVDPKLMKKLSKLKRGDKTVVKTWARDSIVTPEMVGFTLGVHNGKVHVSVTVVENMVGHRLGEFAPTRKFVRHGGRMQKEAEMAAAEAEKKQVEAAKAEAPKK